MGDGFSVDLGALENAAEGINATLNELSNKKVSDLTCSADACGHQDLSDTMSDFDSRWERGVENLASDGQQFADRLSRSVAAYMQVDQNAKGEFDGILTHTTGADPAAGVN